MDLCSQGRHCRAPAGAVHQADHGHALVHRIGPEMLGADVGRVGLARDLLEANRFVTYSLLDPKLPNGEMPNPADAAPAADADSRGGVGKERERLLDPEVGRDGLGAEALAGAMHRPAELGLCG